MKNTHYKERIAFCGINCSSCPAYVITQKQQEQAKARIAKLWSDRDRHYKANEITCKGCSEPWGKKFRHCQECEVRDCARKKLYSTCAECADYPCRKLQNLYKTLDERIHRVNLENISR